MKGNKGRPKGKSKKVMKAPRMPREGESKKEYREYLLRRESKLYGLNQYHQNSIAKDSDIKGVRKQEYTAEEVEQALWKSYGNISEAAAVLGCSYSNVYTYTRRYPVLQEIRKAAKQQLTNDYEVLLHSNVQLAKKVMKDRLMLLEIMSAEDIAKLGIDTEMVNTALQVLSKIDKQNWSDRKEITGADGKPLNPFEGKDRQTIETEFKEMVNEVNALIVKNNDVKVSKRKRVRVEELDNDLVE